MLNMKQKNTHRTKIEKLTKCIILQIKAHLHMAKLNSIEKLSKN